MQKLTQKEIDALYARAEEMDKMAADMEKELKRLKSKPGGGGSTAGPKVCLPKKFQTQLVTALKNFKSTCVKLEADNAALRKRMVEPIEKPLRDAIIESLTNLKNAAAVIEAERDALKAGGGGPAYKPKSIMVFYSSRASDPTAILVAQQLVKKSGINTKAIDKGQYAVPVARTPTDGEVASGFANVLRFLGRAGGFYPRGVVEASKVDGYLSLAESITPDSLTEVAERLNEDLQLKSFLVGYEPTAADVLMYANLKTTAGLDEILKDEEGFPHLIRYYQTLANHPDLQPPAPKAKGGKGGKAKGGKQKGGQKGGKGKQKKGSGAKFDSGIDKKKWQGRVVTRFPPEPSGYLHIGHAKAMMINAEIAKQNGGKMLVRFDDTNPAKEKGEFEDAIVRDIKALGLPIASTSHTSDYFDFYMERVEICIRNGTVYADDRPQAAMKTERMAKQPSPFRNRPVEETLALWEEMKNGSEAGKKCVLRAKLDYDSNNGTLRDPVMYRVNTEDSHHQTGRAYNVYPTYDFACPIVDSLEGVTHAMRSKEYNERNVQYQRVWDIACKGASYKGKPLGRVEIFQFSRMEFVRTMLSKRKLAFLVDNGYVKSWDDPRMPTIQGVLRRGMRVPSLKEFCLAQGTSNRDNAQEWDKIWTINKKVLDPEVRRFQAVSSNPTNRVRLVIVDQKPGTMETGFHPKDKSKGMKTLNLEPAIFLERTDAAGIKEGEKITLTQWGNVIVTKIAADGSMEAKGAFADQNFKGTKKVSWIPDRKDCATATLIELDYLITTKDLPKDGDWKSVINKNTWFETEVALEPAANCLKQGDTIQLLRRGFYQVDAIEPFRLIYIPDGKAKAASALGAATDKVGKSTK